MNEHESAILEALAPCGLDCGCCLARLGGPVQIHAAALLDCLKNFGGHAPRFAAMDPVFASYSAFEDMASWFAQGRCGGCRAGGCLHATCGVGPCARRRGVDFCFRCPDFPCQAHGLPVPLAARWEANNRRMAEVGPGAFLGEVRQKPRYDPC